MLNVIKMFYLKVAMHFRLPFRVTIFCLIKMALLHIVKLNITLFFIGFASFCCAQQDCDDGKTGIDIDLHGDGDWKCPTDRWTESDIEYKAPRAKCYSDQAAYHVCIDEPIDNKYNERIPNSGPHRKTLAVYGEYNYLPPGRYVHSLEHGGVVFMYHPCTPESLVNKLRRVAVSCLNRHVITAFKHLTKDYPLAVLTYGCVHEMSSVNSPEIKTWIRSKFSQSPESNEYAQGIYNHGLLKKSEHVDVPDTVDKYCLDLENDNLPLLLQSKIISTPTVKAVATTTNSITTTTTMAATTVITKTTTLPKQVETVRLLTNRKTRSTTHPHTTTNSTNQVEEVTSQNTVEEVKWAVGCLLFLLIVLFGAVWYSKMWTTNYSDHFDPDTPDVYVNGSWKKTLTIKSLRKKLFNKEAKKQSYKLVEDNADSEDEIY